MLGEGSAVDLDLANMATVGIGGLVGEEVAAALEYGAAALHD